MVEVASYQFVEITVYVRHTRLFKHPRLVDVHVYRSSDAILTLPNYHRDADVLSHLQLT